MYYTGNHILNSIPQEYSDYLFFSGMFIREDIAESKKIKITKRGDIVDINPKRLKDLLNRFTADVKFPVISKVFTSLLITDKVKFIWKFTDEIYRENIFDAKNLGWFQYRMDSLKMKVNWFLSEEKVLLGFENDVLVFLLTPYEEGE